MAEELVNHVHPDARPAHLGREVVPDIVQVQVYDPDPVGHPLERPGHGRERVGPAGLLALRLGEHVFARRGVPNPAKTGKDTLSLGLGFTAVAAAL